MKINRKGNLLSILILLALFLTSCGGANPASDTIATAVAMTVSVQETQKAEATATSIPTEAAPTSMPEATATGQAEPTFAPPTAPGPIGSGDNCVSASYVSETIPDGTIMQPGETFWKTWTIRNEGTCTWDGSYKFIYDSGELMGGLLEYQLTDLVPPGEQMDISIFLKAPSTNGNYRGNWKILSPWGGTFGVSDYNTPLWVQINVNDASSPDYTVTNVTYNIVRNPATGCHTNQWYTVHATITTNGPVTVRYQWLQSDGNNSGTGNDRVLKFTQADSITVSREWKFHLADSPGTKWMQIVIHEPQYQEYPRATWVYNCGN